ncbi:MULTISPECIES: hypothetical protein [Pseudomonas]|uniref:hypothetical protein n=1 Tax=Pseudomonas TaxID=286 RepID=UPI000C8829A1|nr:MULTISPECIES: hypothetical protein [Pseudomonas]PMY40107.1 hypothetical protein C1Y36_24135 [Pseudomonas sp. FW306-2-2C-D06C]PYC41830.1 hypothetical protein DMW99_00255 [Pseudomonas chlororaphis]
MTLTRYIYNGPQSGATLRVGEARELLDVVLQPGKPVELPADHDYTLVLLELKHLVLAPPEAKPAGKAAAVSQKPGQE